MTTTRFYRLFSVFCLGGVCWLIIQLYASRLNNSMPSLCIMKIIIGIPCPSCGSTRALVAILDGEFIKAFFLNPLGFLIAGLIFTVPLWLATDLISRKQTLYEAYQGIEKLLRNGYLAVPLVLLVIANWIWNIFKEI